jgi:hypothetical protein
MAIRRIIRDSFADRLLQTLLLMVISAAFVFAFVFEADSAVVFGVLITGAIAAIVESTNRRRRR